MSSARAINPLPAWAKIVLFQGRCPHCHKHAFLRCELPGSTTTLLCSGCYREYHVGATLAELLHVFCPAPRLKAVYGLTYCLAPPDSKT